jgi:DeoR family transcriptional regulator, aga operon transcriptional repressor
MLLVERARSVIVVADSSKLGRRAFARICATEAIDTLVTDTSATDEQIAPFEAAGLRVVRA